MVRKRKAKPLRTIALLHKDDEHASGSMSKTLSRADSFSIMAGTTQPVEVATVNSITVNIIPSTAAQGGDLVVASTNIVSPSFHTNSPITLTLRFLDKEADRIDDVDFRFAVVRSGKGQNYAVTTTVAHGSLDAAITFQRRIAGGDWLPD
jgi:hypothetical protein